MPLQLSLGVYNAVGLSMVCGLVLLQGGMNSGQIHTSFGLSMSLV